MSRCSSSRSAPPDRRRPHQPLGARRAPAERDRRRRAHRVVDVRRLATGTISVLNVAGLTLSGSASLSFNNTGADVDQTITYPTASGSASIEVKVASGTTSLRASKATVPVGGQTLTGAFSLSSSTTSAGTWMTLTSTVYADTGRRRDDGRDGGSLDRQHDDDRRRWNVQQQPDRDGDDRAERRGLAQRWHR